MPVPVPVPAAAVRGRRAGGRPMETLVTAPSACAADMQRCTLLRRPAQSAWPGHRQGQWREKRGGWGGGEGAEVLKSNKTSRGAWAVPVVIKAQTQTHTPTHVHRHTHTHPQTHTHSHTLTDTHTHLLLGCAFEDVAEKVLG